MDLSLSAATGVIGFYLAVVRPAIYALYYTAGNVSAAKDGRRITESEAREIGRALVWQTCILFIERKGREIDWPSIGAGVDHFFKNLPVHAALWWRGRKRDFRLARDWLLGRLRQRPLPAATRQMLFVAERAEQRAQGLVEAHSIMSAETAADIRKQIARLINLAEQRPLTPDEERELAALREWIATYHRRILADADPNPAVQPAAAVPTFFTAPMGNPWIRITALVAVIAVALVWGQQFRINSLKSKNRVYAQNEKVWMADIKTRDQRLNDLRGEIKTLGVQCLSETKAAADRRAAQDARARIADAKARKKLNEAASQAGVAQPFDLDSRLRSLSEPSDIEPAPTRTAPAEGVADGVLREGTAPTAPADGG